MRPGGYALFFINFCGFVFLCVSARFCAGLVMSAVRLFRLVLSTRSCFCLPLLGPRPLGSPRVHLGPLVAARVRLKRAPGVLWHQRHGAEEMRR